MSGFAPPKEVNMSDQHRHQLEIKGYNELLAEHCELVDRLEAIEALLQRLHLPDLVAEIEAINCGGSCIITVTLRLTQ